MKKLIKNGFNLTELLVTMAIISALSFIAIPPLLPKIKEFSLKENVLTVTQVLNETRSLAIKKSARVYADFSQAGTNHENTGGLIQIVQGDGTILSQVYLDQNILFNSSQSSIQNKSVNFDYKGRPVDSTNNTDNFTSSNNTIAVSYYNLSNQAIHTKTIKIAPMTGAIQSQ